MVSASLTGINILKLYRVWSVNTSNRVPLWVMGEYTSKKKAIDRGRQIISEASLEGVKRGEVALCRASISIDNSTDHDCVYLKAEKEIVGIVIEAVTADDPDEELIHLLTQVLAENFKATEEG